MQGKCNLTPNNFKQSIFTTFTHYILLLTALAKVIKAFAIPREK